MILDIDHIPLTAWNNFQHFVDNEYQSDVATYVEDLVVLGYATNAVGDPLDGKFETTEELWSWFLLKWS